jgi:gamma-glutamyltranspeptidase/glutathione hydrolase
MFPTHRGVVVAKNGVVAASQPLAVSAGLNVLQNGGTFIDAAIATSAVLAVTEPYASHLGGDAFVIVYDAATKRTTAFNASGPAPLAASLNKFNDGIPIRGLASASVPGLVDSWFHLHGRYGSISVASLLAPAIRYAEEGFPAGYKYSSAFKLHSQNGAPWFPALMKQVTGLNAPPRPGQWIKQPDLAWTLSQIASGGREAFYDGPVTERMVDFSKRNGGLFSRQDFASYSCQISEPIRTDYRGYTVHGQPPVSQGHILLQELNLVEGYDLAGFGWGSADTVHRMVEAKKLAFADRYAYLGDPDVVKVPLETLLSKDYAAKRREEIDPQRAMNVANPGQVDHDTTYFCVADKDGNTASFIQSVFHGFGCGVVAEGTGVLFNNRMTGFSLDTDSPNMLAPGKRPAHTLNAYLITKGDQLAWVGGTPGGDIQVQSNLQVISNVIDFGMNPQQAVEAPRWQHGPSVQSEVETPADLLEMEERYSPETFEGLSQKGHQVKAIGPWAHGSSYQLIQYDNESGAYHAGSDPRCDGQAAGY